MSRRSPFQFSLRTLLIVTTAAALLFTGMRFFGVDPMMALVWVGVACIAIMIVVTWMYQSIETAARHDSMSPCSVASVLHAAEASLIIDELAHHGIEARSVGGYTSGFQIGFPGEVQVVVAQQDFERAQAVLADFRVEEIRVDSRQDADDEREKPT